MLRESDWELAKETVWERTGDRSGINYVRTDAIIEETVFCQEFWVALRLCSDEHMGSCDGFNRIDIRGNGSHHCLWASICFDIYVVIVMLSANVYFVDGVVDGFISTDYCPSWTRPCCKRLDDEAAKYMYSSYNVYPLPLGKSWWWISGDSASREQEGCCH